jgi:hypothetical protein
MSEVLSICPVCQQKMVKTSTVYFRELKAGVATTIETETVIEQECMACGWIASSPVPATS